MWSECEVHAGADVVLLLDGIVCVKVVLYDLPRARVCVCVEMIFWGCSGPVTPAVFAVLWDHCMRQWVVIYKSELSGSSVCDVVLVGFHVHPYLTRVDASPPVVYVLLGGALVYMGVLFAICSTAPVLCWVLGSVVSGMCFTVL